MNAFDHFPARLHWNAQQLADAVPLQLHELYVADVVGDAAQRAANRSARVPHRLSGYVAPARLPARFQIR